MLAYQAYDFIVFVIVNYFDFPTIKSIERNHYSFLYTLMMKKIKFKRFVQFIVLEFKNEA